MHEAPVKEFDDEQLTTVVRFFMKISLLGSSLSFLTGFEYILNAFRTVESSSVFKKLLVSKEKKSNTSENCFELTYACSLPRFRKLCSRLYEKSSRWEG